MERPTLSVIIPVYNGSKFIGDTISSILAQPCKDFELILLDDGSTDNSLDVCKSFNSENVRVLSQANMGVSKTRNRGIEEAKGDIIIFSDQDDSMKRNFYTEDMRQKLLTAYNEGIDMIIPGRWVGDNDLSKGKFVSIEKYKSGIYQGHSDSLSWEFYNVFNANIYFRRLFYNQCDEKAPVRFLDLPLDVETTFRHMAQYASDKILLSDEYSFSVRRANISSVSSTWDWLKVYPVRCDAYYQLIDWHKINYPQDDKAIAGAERHFLNAFVLLIKENFKAKVDLMALYNDIRKKIYFDDLNYFIIKYPEESSLIKAFFENPLSIDKYLEVSRFRKLAQKRYVLIAAIKGLFIKDKSLPL